MKNVKILFAIMLSTCFVLAGCSGNETTTNTQSEISNVSSSTSISNSDVSEISKQIDLDEFEKKFNEAKNYNQKYSVLKDFYDNVSNIESNNSAKNLLNTMRKYFKDDFDKQIKVYTFDVNNKNIKLNNNTLKNAKEKLSSILSSIVKNKDIIFTEDEIKTYQDNIDKLIISYDKFIKNNDNSSSKSESSKPTSSKTESSKKPASSKSESSSSSNNNYENSNSESHQPADENNNYQENSKYEESSKPTISSKVDKPVSKPVSSKPSTKPSSKPSTSSKPESSSQSNGVRWIINEYKNDTRPNVKASRKFNFVNKGIQRTITIPDCVGSTYELNCIVWYDSNGNPDSWNCKDRISGWCWGDNGYYWNSSELSEWGW